jgi:hypothetical protein
MLKFSALILIFASSLAFAEKGVEIDVKLSPAGGFIARAPVTAGSAHKNGDSVSAEGVEVDLTQIKTGIDLRDKHTKARLLVDQHPKAKLVRAEGKGGKGKATINVRGKDTEVNGTYEVKGGDLVAKFPMSISALGITDAKYMGVGAKDEVIVTVEVPITEGAPASEASPAKKKVKKKK